MALASAWRAQGAWLLARAEQRPGAQLRLAALDPLLARHPYLADGYRLRGLAWRELAAGTEEYNPEMGLLIQILAVHRRARAAQPSP